MNPINLQQQTRSPKCDDYYDTTMTKEECQTCYDPFGYMDDAEHMITNAGKVACSGRSYNDHQCRDRFPDIPRTKTSYHLICPDLVECQKEFDYGNECGDLGCCGWLPYDEEKGWVRDQTASRDLGFLMWKPLLLDYLLSLVRAEGRQSQLIKMVMLSMKMILMSYRIRFQ